MTTKAPVIKTRQRPGLSLLMDREADRQPPLLNAQLIDCSRDEIQVLVSHSLDRGERVRVRLRDESSGLQLDVVGNVSAQREAPPSGWSVTCRFDHELDWETLGELFLCGILEHVPR
jgi:hypothetical protein